MDKILQNWNNFLNEQTEPYQKKMKAGHSRKKKRVIGHGGQKAGPPYSIKPSMERSKSAPPMGESIEYSVLEEGIFSDVMDKLSNSLGLSKSKPLSNVVAGVASSSNSYKETSGSPFGYSKVTENLYVGAEPVEGLGKLPKEELQKFYKIFVMAEEHEYSRSFEISDPEVIKKTGSNERQQNTLKDLMRELPDKVVYIPTKDIDKPLNDKEKEDLQLTLNDLKLAGQQIYQATKNGKVLVVCSKGLNRSATAAGLSIIASGISADQAIEMLKNARGERSLASKSGRQHTPHSSFLNLLKGTQQVNERKFKKGSKFCLKSKKGDKNLGCYDTEAQRDKREKQVEMFKHMNEGTLESFNNYSNKVEESLRRVIRRLIREQHGRKRYT